VWSTRKEAARAVVRWIEETDNRKRLYSSLGDVTPVEFEQAIKNKQTDTQETAKVA